MNKCCKMFFLIIFTLVININAQESAKYLESAIEDLKTMNSLRSQRKVDTPTNSKNTNPKSVPPLALTKHDLARLYQAAVNKGDSVILDADTGAHTQAAVYEIEDAPSSNYVHHTTKLPKYDHQEDPSGYYYYYYPIKSFMDEKYHEDHDDHPQETYYHGHHEEPTKPKVHQYHTHTHEHNVHVTTIKQKMEEHKKHKALQPLFMAISGFIGMAIMFVLSSLMLPKIGILKSRGVKEPTGEATNIFKVIFQAIEGQDCTERFTCELGKTAKAFNVHNNRFIKLIKRVAPVYISKRLSNIDKYANKKYKCALISCKKKVRPAKTQPTKETDKS